MRELYGVIWRYAWKRYAILTALVLLSLPFLYVAVELGKNIVDIIATSSAANVPYLQQIAQELSTKQVLILFTILFLLVVLVNVLFTESIKALKGIFAEHVMRNMRHNMVRDNHSHGKLTDEFALSATHEIQELKDFFEAAIATPLQEGGRLATLVLFIFIQDWRLGIIAVLVVPIQAFIVYSFQDPINRQSAKHISTLRDINDGVNDHEQPEKVHRKIEDAYHTQRKKFILKFVSKSIIHALAKTPVALFYLVGGVMALSGHITPGAVVAVVGAHSSIQGHWNSLFSFYRIKEGARIRLMKVREINQG